MQDSALDMLQSQQNKAAGGWMETILNLIPGRKQQAANEPSEEAIKRTHEFLRLSPAGPLCRQTGLLWAQHPHWPIFAIVPKKSLS